jgi:PTS system mannose-specific IID component
MRLGFTRFLKIFITSFFMQTSWSFYTMQGLGFLFNLMTGIKKDKREEVLKTHEGFFNTHPYVSSYIVGAIVRAYDEETHSVEEVKKFIDIAQKSFASAGDILFWQTLRPALLLLGTVLALKAGIIGPILFLVVYTVFHFYHRIQGIYDGYAMKWDVIYLLRSKRFTFVQQFFEIVGAFCSGLLVWLMALKAHYLFCLPLAAFILFLLLKRTSSVVIMFVIIFLIIIIVSLGV